MPIDPQEVRRIAELAELDLDDETVSRFTEQLQSILDYVRAIEPLDVDSVAPTGCVPGERQPLREDEETPCLTSEEALRNAPDSGDGHFRVPRVIKT